MRNKKVAFLIFFSALFFVACSQKPAKNVENQGEPEPIEMPASEECSYVSIETDLGNIVVRLYNETPRHRDNFLKLVNEGFYDGLLFHRVINNFMIQGGDPKSKVCHILSLQSSSLRCSIKRELWLQPVRVITLTPTKSRLLVSSISFKAMCGTSTNSR